MGVDNKSQRGNNFTVFWGVAVEDKPEGSKTLKVRLLEATPYSTGKNEKLEENVSLSDSLDDEKSETYASSITTVNYVNAQYFDAQSNRAYPPDVVQNEQVLVLNYGDSDVYYWYSSGRDDNLRKNETLRFQTANSPEPLKTLSEENAYYIELNTKTDKKKVIIQTTKSDGETYAYTLLLDAKNNKVYLCDDDDNMLLIESATPRVMLRNKNGSMIDINANNLACVAIEDMSFKAGRQITTSSPIRTSSQDTSGETDVTTNKNSLHKSSNSHIIEAPCVGINGALVCDTIVCKHVQSEDGYDVGSVGTKYNSPGTNVDAGKAVDATNAPNTGGGTANNRHCAAWEDLTEAFNILAGMVACNCAHTGCDDQTAAMLAKVASAKMKKNKGE